MNDFITPNSILLLSAELMFILARSKEIKIQFKRKNQLSTEEKQFRERGLLRSLILEILVFVPASALLISFVAPLIIPSSIIQNSAAQRTYNAVLGMISYGFPFGTLKKVLTNIAVNAIKESVRSISETNSSAVRSDNL